MTTEKSLHSEIAWNALLRELRSSRKSVEAMASGGNLGKKRRARFDKEDAGVVQERKVRCLRNESNGTFLDLNPPSSFEQTSSDALVFTFGSRHYKTISLADLANASCACSSAGSSKFEVFSAFRCPCKSRVKTPTKSLKSNKCIPSGSSKKSAGSKKLRAMEAL